MIKEAIRWVAIVAVLIGSVTANGQTIIDAAMVDIGGQSMRFYGIDVADAEQSCDDGKWFPRKEATAALVAFVAGRPITCSQVSYDYVAKVPEVMCFVDDRDLQSFLIGSGLAWAARPGSLRYVDSERRAESLKLGVHGHNCERADRWRRKRAALR